MLLQHEQRQTITQRIDPKIILANSILQLTTLELAQSVESELNDNPALDTVDEYVCSGDCIDPANCPYCMARRARAASEDEPQHESLDSGEEGSEYSHYYETNAANPDEEHDLVGNLEAELTLQEHLRGLLRAAVPTEDFPIGEYIISCLDERGWLDGSVEEIAAELGVEENDVCRLLSVLQSFNDPPGVAARTIQECMLLQLQYLREEETTATNRKTLSLAIRLVRDHFDLFHSHRFARLARLTGATTGEVRLCEEFIRSRLNPYPASQFRPPWSYSPTNSKAAVRPDVIVRRTEYGYDVEVLGLELFGLCINPYYREEYNQIKRGGARYTLDHKKHVLEYVERAELFIRNINQRRLTLQQITRCIIEEQIGFLETGSRRFLRPLTRTRVAQLLGLHESTVSRATANKFVQLPNQDVISFEVFFDPSLSTKEAIEDIIHQEDPSNPLSDKQIVERLQERGIEVARRTIVKYREDRKILSSTRRRR